MKKQTDEIPFFLMHVDDAPSIAPDREEPPLTLDHSDLQPLHGIDFESSLLIDEMIYKKSEGLGRLLLGSLMAFAAISAISTAEAISAGIRSLPQWLRGATMAVVDYAKTSWVTTLKLLSLRRVLAAIRSVRGDKE